jgi:small subunit ribosomal protein S4
MNFRGPKVKLSRSLGLPLTPQAAEIMKRRPYGPGQHGQARSRKPSEYKVQLLEKQRVRFQYNISERQMSNYFERAARANGATGEVLIQLLETRLDAFVYRAGFARTIYAARQYVTHGHLLVNGKAVNIPSYSLKVGDVVSVKPNSSLLQQMEEALKSASQPAYISVVNGNSARFVQMPGREDVPVIGELSLVVEYYSR